MQSVAALGRALETAPRRYPIPERVTVFTDAQAAIRRMASEEPGPSQKYALQSRKHHSAEEGQARHRHRDPVVRGAQWGPWKRESR